MNIDLKFYARLLLRRAPVMLVLILISSVLGIALALRLPTTYQTSARLIVQPQQISEDLVSSTVQINALEEVRLLQEQLLTRTNLLEIARAHSVFEDIGQLVPNDVVTRMRASTRIRAQGGRGRPVLVTVSFTARQPQIAADVVNDYVTRITEENVRIRTGAAGETLDFFEREVERLATELDLSSARITQFQQENADALPGDQNYRLQRQTLMQERLADAERELRAVAETRQRTLDVFEATGRVEGGGRNRSPAERELAELEADLIRALTVFSETAPQVELLRRRIDALQETITAQAGIDGTGAATGPEALLNLQLTELDARAERLQARIVNTEAELIALEDAISRTPLNTITLEGLRRDYNNTRTQYDSAVARLSRASLGERIEVTSRGQRIALIEPAAVPNRPASPNRPLIAGTGVSVGLGLAAAFFLILELLNRTVRRPVEIVSKLGITPLATIPYLESSWERFFRRALRVSAALVVLTGVPAALWAIDTYYLPLDLVVDQLIDRLGLA